MPLTSTTELSLQNKQILLGITGGIAAYKSAELVRRLKEFGATVRVVMTAAATEFITPLTLQALSGNPVHTSLLDTEAEAAMGHIALARWADAILVAPCSADFMAKLVAGEGGDLLSTLCLASTAPLAIAPAMNQAMWHNSATQQNVSLLQNRGLRIFGPAQGDQACGDSGLGRMQEPAQLATELAQLFSTGLLAGQTVVVTAGPTREAIDPVRYISNHSSGKMGYAIAEAAIEAGAKVTLISGPVNLDAPDRCTLVAVTTAAEMYREAMRYAPQSHLFIGAAAVADYSPRMVASQKIKKSTDTMVIELEKTPDVIAAVASLECRPFTVGFAAETEQVDSHAKQKLQKKNLDMIIANDVSDQSIGFNSDDNAVSVISHQGVISLGKVKKTTLARQLIKEIASQMAQR